MSESAFCDAIRSSIKLECDWHYEQEVDGEEVDDEYEIDNPDRVLSDFTHKREPCETEAIYTEGETLLANASPKYEDLSEDCLEKLSGVSSTAAFSTITSDVLSDEDSNISRTSRSQRLQDLDDSIVLGTSGSQGYQHPEGVRISRTSGYRKTRKVRSNTLSGRRSFACDICGAVFLQRGNMTTHRRVHTDRPRRYKCHICRAAFHDASNLRKHALVHSRRRPFACDRCGRRFKRANSLKEHGSRCRSPSVSSASVSSPHVSSPHVGKRVLSVERHNEVHAELVHGCYMCATCRLTFPERRLLAEHTVRVHGKALVDFTNISKHVETSGGGVSRSDLSTPLHWFVCDACGFGNRHLKKVVRHLQVHSKLPAFVCPLCGKGLKRRSYLEDHFMSKGCRRLAEDKSINIEEFLKRQKRVKKPDNDVVAMPNPNKIECPPGIHMQVYDASCRLQDELRTKRRCVEKQNLCGSGRYQCLLCDYSFTLKQNLKRHAFNVHQISDPYVQMKKRPSRWRS